jgi:peptidoglycan/LPS O-acetylase OafA/YrhL
VEGKKLYYLESLRGIAALMVVAQHFVGSFFPAVNGGSTYPIHSPFDLWFHKTPLGVVFGGNFAVCIFFVLSGFVLTRAFYLTRQPEYLAKAAVKRYVRLMPPVAGSVCLAYVLLKTGAFHNAQAAALSGSDGLGELWHMTPHIWPAVQLALVDAFMKGSSGAGSLNPPLWTMNVEFVGSFVVFSLAAVSVLLARRGWLYLLAVALTWHTYFLGFVIGLVLADLASLPRVQEAVGRVRGWVWPIVMGAALVLGGFPSSGHPADTLYRWFPNLPGTPLEALMTWHLLGAGLLVVAVMGWPRAQRVLEWRPFVRLGRMSFGLYLTHFLIIGTYSSYLFTALALTHGYRSSFLIMLVPSLVIIFITADIFTRWLDRPAVAWSAWFGRWAVAPRRLSPDGVPAPAPQIQG